MSVCVCVGGGGGGGPSSANDFLDCITPQGTRAAVPFYSRQVVEATLFHPVVNAPAFSAKGTKLPFCAIY